MILKAGAALMLVAVVFYFINRLIARMKAWQANRRLHGQLLRLPPVKADLTTPEGAILCLEDAFARRDIEAAAACRDFLAEAKLWIHERGHLSRETQAEMLAETTKVLEKSFRDNVNRAWQTDWKRAKSYFPSREQDSHGIIVNEYTAIPGNPLLQRRFLTAQNNGGWRIVKQLPVYPDSVN